ncbi:DNA-directed RNA polymerase II subunit [Syncephalastrum racemosum]|uniref:DNA-directed RNA polymerase II subunit n=1 Tax=Syncephalastrum racemosum TaxID=13706 RepID=A0A1X2HSD2_SYNRA|nr:DNA-directed RNA polymerase II subunit [Syncephalastrum racemosum]
MFFLKDLVHTITLHPSFFGPNMHTQIKEKLYQDVEGTCSGRYGYIITVLSLSNISKGKVLPGSGLAEFKVNYQAIVFKPYKGEVLDAIVTTVNKMGFFADVGPLQVFVSSHLIPNDMHYDPNGNPPCYSSDDQVIHKDMQVRIKLVGTRIDATEIFAIGTIKEDYLGVISI